MNETIPNIMKQHVKKFEREKMYNNTPTKKQVKYANDIYERTGIPLPSQETFSAYREYIASNKDAPDATQVSINHCTGEAKVTLYVKKMPDNCGECPFYQWNEHRGDGVSHSCPFGCSHFGCLVERPEDCPLRANIDSYGNDYCGGLACQVED